jgi:hypothetical protein
VATPPSLYAREKEEPVKIEKMLGESIAAAATVVHRQSKYMTISDANKVFSWDTDDSHSDSL